LCLQCGASIAVSCVDSILMGKTFAHAMSFNVAEVDVHYRFDVVLCIKTNEK
jgi:hypothetical protein